MSRKYYCYAIIAALTTSQPLVTAQELAAHVHGVATLQVAVDEKTLTLDFSGPLDNLLGFEHIPRDAKQKAAVKKMADDLNHAESLFIPTADAQCTLQSVKLASQVLEPKSAQEKQSDRKKESEHHDETSGHTDIDGEFVFACKQIGKLHDLDVKLFDAFPHLGQLKVEVATQKKQFAAKLTAKQPRMNW